MPARLAPLIALSCLGLVACGSLDSREWMKVEQRDAKADLQRDHKACSKKGDVDESCMRARGWVPVNPTKEEAAPKSADPLSRGRGRY